MTTRKIRPSLLYSIIVSLPYLIGVFLTLVIMGSFPETKFIDPYNLPFSIAFYIYRVLLVRSNVFEINKEQATYKRGVFSKRINFLELYRIKDYFIHKPWYQRLIGTMTVIIKSSDKNIPELTLKGVPDSEFVSNLRNLVELQRKNKRVYEID